MRAGGGRGLALRSVDVHLLWAVGGAAPSSVLSCPSCRCVPLSLCPLVHSRHSRASEPRLRTPVNRESRI
ncbi:hypothetical protein O3P69_018846 [Scylla paramamosain]|uniref:Secreted protein n=1 Tax=Scylla paramamosain TaxID=85552 RepID=A0AAW0SS27_SCYPA